MVGTTTIDVDDYTTPSEAVIEAVAAVNGVRPIDLDEQLYDVVDPDALNDFVGSADDARCRVAFPMAGCTVVVDGGGEVFVSLDAAAAAKTPLGART